MQQNFSHISTGFLLTLIFVFAISGFLFPQTARAAEMGICTEGKASDITTQANCNGTWKPLKEQVPGRWENLKNALWSAAGVAADAGTDILLTPLGWLAILILQIASLITYLGGIILNLVVITTVVDMAKNLKDLDVINLAWKTIRDIANIGFIFILLYAAIKTILGIGDDVKKLIVNIIIVAILINFSLFFTKVVIDSSNVLALTFYDRIAPGATASNLSLGLSSSLMEPLKITTLWKITSWEDIFAGKKMIIVGLLGTVVSLIAAFVFFAVAVMFVIRFVVLIFVMILSPLAFMGYILPGLKTYKDQWIQALIGQAFFAPIYLMLTWIVIVVSRGLFASAGFRGAGAAATMAQNFTGIAGADGNFTPPPHGSLALLMNFIIMIAFLIASLIIAKQWADKAGHGVPGLTKWATGFAGGATLGAIGMGMRSSVGSRMAAMASNEELKKKAAEGSIRARLQLAAASKAAKSSFDLRGTPLGGQLDAGKTKKGGFIQDQKDRAKAYEKYKPDSDAIKTAKAEAIKAQEKLDIAREKTIKLEAGGIEKTSEEFIEAEKQLKEAHDTAARARLKRMELNNRMTRMANRIEKGWGGTGFGGVAVSAKDKASAIRAAAKIKPAIDQAADVLKNLQKEGIIAEEEKPETQTEKPEDTTQDENKQTP